MEDTDRQSLIARYQAGYDEVTASLAGITAAKLDAQPLAGEWSVRMIIHHLADSEMTSGIRLRRLLAEDQPVIQGYDEGLFAQRLHYDRPIETSLDVLRAVRQSAASLLAILTPDEWARMGIHSESGSYSVETWLAIYADHAHDHAAQIRRVRAALD